MGYQLFWLVHVVRINHHTLMWLGDKFLEPYHRLYRPNESRDWIDRVV